MAEISIQSIISKIRIRTVREDTWDLEDIGRALANTSEMDTGDAINFTYKLFDMIVENVNRGIHMKLGKLGTVGVSVDTQGTVKPSFRSSSELRTAVKAYNGRFKYAENRGLDDEGFARTWLAEHPEDIVQMRDGTTRTQADYSD